MVRSPDLRSTHSPWRGDLFSRSFAQSCARALQRGAHISTETSITARMLPTECARCMQIQMSILCQLRCHRRCFSFADQCINAPAAGAVEEDEKEDPGVEHGELAVIQDRKKLRCGSRGGGHMYHEIGHSHFTTQDKRDETR